MTSWCAAHLVILAYTIVITEICSCSLLTSPLIGSQKIHNLKNYWPDEHTSFKLNEKDVDKSFAFGAGVVDMLHRLETSLGWSQIDVKLGTPAHSQLVNNYPDVEALVQAKKALIATKATTHLMSSYCHKKKLNPSSCAKHFTKLKTSSHHQNHICPKVSRSCTVEESTTAYRSPDGSCNHLAKSHIGQSFTSYKRLLFPQYLDGIQEVKRSVNRKYKLPSPRTISTSLAGREAFEDTSRTLAVMQWGQFISHDMYHTVVNKMIHTGATIQCCSPSGSKLSPRYIHPFCSPIEIAPNDKFYSKHGIQCMTYVRSVAGDRPDCSLGPIEQLNQATHFLDGSQIYGSTKDKALELRSGVGGELKTSVVFGKELLPLIDDPSKYCQVKSGDEACFKAGDSRVNSQPQLTVMHTIWVREHNRIARKLQELNPDWNDERLYQEARKIVVAEIQHITYKQWLPIILGSGYSEVMQKPSSYDEDTDASVSNSFATAAFRFTKSMMASTLSMYSEDRVVNSTTKLADNFNKPEIITKPGYLDGFVRGLATQQSQKADFHYIEDVADLLYGNGNVGFDVVSLDIQRGRDHGLPAYPYYRTLFGLHQTNSFKDFGDFISQKMVKALAEVYNDPYDVDLLVGGMLEHSFKGSLLGPTLSGLIATQFFQTKNGDRYFYTSSSQPVPFTRPQLAEVMKASLARVFCDNGDDINMMQSDVFQIITKTNYLEKCTSSSLQQINLDLWKE